MINRTGRQVRGGCDHIACIAGVVHRAIAIGIDTHIHKLHRPARGYRATQGVGLGVAGLVGHIQIERGDRTCCCCVGLGRRAGVLVGIDRAITHTGRVGSVGNIHGRRINGAQYTRGGIRLGIVARRGRRQVELVRADTTGAGRQIGFHGDVHRFRRIQLAGVRVTVTVGVSDLNRARSIPEGERGTCRERIGRIVGCAQLEHIHAIPVVGNGVLEVDHGTTGRTGNSVDVVIGAIGAIFGVVGIHSVGLTNHSGNCVGAYRCFGGTDIVVQVALGRKGVLDLGTGRRRRIKAHLVHDRYRGVHTQAVIGQQNTGDTGFTAGAVTVQIHTRRLINRGQ